MGPGQVMAFLFVLGLTGLYLINPSTAGLPPCPIHAFLNLYCPGCGSLRSLHCLLNGHILQAWRYNPLVLCVLPVVCLGILHEYYPHRHLAPSQIKPMLVWGLLGITITFGILRNVPALNYLKPQEICCQQWAAPYVAQSAPSGER